MSSELGESFTIMWQVKNFSMCPTKFRCFIQSPVILVRQFGNSEWSLKLYPKGNTAEGFIACYLACESLNVLKKAEVEFKLSVVTKSSDKMLRKTENDYKLNKDWGYNKWISIEKIKKEKDEYLPKDNLTIRCTIKCINPSDTKNTEVEIINALTRNFLSKKITLNISKCCFETTIRVQTKRFLWPIPRFLSLSKNERITLPVFSSMKETPSFNVTLIKNTESFLRIEIRRKNEKSCNTFVRCTVSAINTPKDYSLEDEFLFEFEGDVWSFSRSLNVSVLEEDGYFKLNEGVLYLQFDFAYSIQDQFHHIEKQDREPFIPPTKNSVPLELFTTPTANEEHPVVTLRTEHKTFTVHKALLTAKSQVFRAMFDNDMKEKETGAVDIPDVEPETLGRMLSFFYCGSVGDISTTDAIDLYAAAHKYQVFSLIDYCSSVLMSSLTVSNVWDILKFAFLYRDERLLKAVEDFLIADSDSDRILLSEDWKNLMESNLPFAANIMYKMLIK